MGAVVSALFALLALLALWAPISHAQPAPSLALDALSERAVAEGRVKVLVRLNTPWQAEAPLGLSGRSAQRQALSAAQARLEAELLPHGGAAVARRYATVPMLAVEVDPRALARLRASPSVSQLTEDRRLPLNLLQSTELIHAPTAWARGLQGTGWAVAVLDTGVDGTHPFLAGKVVAEACFSTASSALRSTSLCPGGAESLTGPGAGVPCTGPSLCTHGTHVAGIAAGALRVADGSRGVAPGAQLVSVQVLSAVSSGKPGAVPRLEAWNSDLLAALEHVYSLRERVPIAAINMSLGTGRYEQACDDDPLKPIIDQLRAAGIATVVAAGNNGFKQAMNTPACISSAISVGATCDEATGSFCAAGVDGMASYSNLTGGTSLLAPGSLITSSLPGGGYARWSGTSMAAPHVAGAWALMRHWRPEASVQAVLADLRAHAVTLNDTRPGGVASGLKRVDLAFAAQQARWPLTVVKSGGAAALGAVHSAPAGVACGDTCASSFDNGTRVTLTAQSPADAVFAGWSGACTGTQPVCVLNLDAARSVTARFEPRPVSRFVFGAPQLTVVEGQLRATLTVLRGTDEGAASVAYATSDDSALAGPDYAARAGTLRFAHGRSSRTITVPIRNDRVAEVAKRFTVRLSQPVGGELGLTSIATVTIADDD